MAALGKVLEAKCSYFDVLSFMCSPHPAQNITLYLKIFVCGALFLKKLFFIQVGFAQSAALKKLANSRRLH